MEVFLRGYTLDRLTSWLHWLPYAEFAYNSACHFATGFAPLEILYGRRILCWPAPALPVPEVTVSGHLETIRELHQQVHSRLEAARATMKLQADKHRSFRTFTIGDLVYIKFRPHRHTLGCRAGSRSKLTQCKLYFVKVIERINEVAFRLALPQGCKLHDVFHVSELKLHYGPTPLSTVEVPVRSLGDQHLVVPDKVIDVETRQLRRRTIKRYLVRWMNTGGDTDTWLSQQEFDRLFWCTCFSGILCYQPALGTELFKVGGNVMSYSWLITSTDAGRQGICTRHIWSDWRKVGGATQSKTNTQPKKAAKMKTPVQGLE
ncbi:uncharacterized protein LOC112341017 [Selaginella moellendorffii]|uniref:uncharacterized protein LOC112341017 n=1 Tax=Selaginella moellendorffii TaxID=88036 RepID=UPI000D1D02CF|nr:uncharacterized protein LOC112341017 [Selaginella moellendorffii]|eukprot:XP_024516135.1 uncharacterized protein LOC112341017 [Selaginella moellendorffii]